MRKQLAERWSRRANDMFAGKKIKEFKYADTGSDDGLAPTIVLEDGSMLHAMADDEGNGPGALHTTDDDFPIIPTIR